jgi:hypothetical protein
MKATDELQLLKDAQAEAFGCQHRARSILDEAWFIRLTAINDTQIAYKAMKCALEAKRQKRETYLATRATNSPRIEQLAVLEQEARTRKVDASAASQQAYKAWDHKLARELSREKGLHQTQEDEYRQQRRALMADITATRLAYECACDAYGPARTDFLAARAVYESANTGYEHALSEFQLAHEAFGQVTEAMRSHIGQMCSGQDPILISQAGIPSDYVQQCWTRPMSDGTVHFYFGGIGLPDGPEHGHRKMSAEGSITYAREPFEPRGAHNHIDTVVEVGAP